MREKCISDVDANERPWKSVPVSVLIEKRGRRQRSQPRASGMMIGSTFERLLNESWLAPAFDRDARIRTSRTRARAVGRRSCSHRTAFPTRRDACGNDNIFMTVRCDVDHRCRLATALGSLRPRSGQIDQRRPDREVKVPLIVVDGLERAALFAGGDIESDNRASICRRTACGGR